MSAEPENEQMSGVQEPSSKGKNKGKAPEHDTMGEATDSESSDESANEDQAGEVEEPDEDNMEEIETSNIIGSRTRGKNIDFAKADKELGEDNDEDEDEDEDFVDPDDEMKD